MERQVVPDGGTRNRKRPLADCREIVLFSFILFYDVDDDDDVLRRVGQVFGCYDGVHWIVARARGRRGRQPSGRLHPVLDVRRVDVAVLSGQQPGWRRNSL